MRKSSNKRIHLKDMSIKTTILILFIVILIGTVGSIGCITYSSWIKSIDDTIIKTVTTLNNQIINEIDEFMTSSKRLNLANRKLVESNFLDISNNDASRELLFVNALSSFDGVFKEACKNKLYN